jgi:hypothetical protein
LEYKLVHFKNKTLNAYEKKERNGVFDEKSKLSFYHFLYCPHCHVHRGNKSPRNYHGFTEKEIGDFIEALKEQQDKDAGPEIE